MAKSPKNFDYDNSITTLIPREPYRIGKLLFPFRYDLWMRRLVVEAYVKHRELYHADFDAFLEEAYDDGLWVIYEHTHLYKMRNQLRKLCGLKAIYGQEMKNRAMALYIADIEKCQWLYDSIEKDGFWRGEQHMFKLKTLDRPRKSLVERHILPDGVHMFSDGQHRLCVWQAMGHEYFEPGMYKIYNWPHPRKHWESTGFWIRGGLVTEEDYCDFARYRWPELEEDVTDVATLVEWMRDTDKPAHCADWTEDYWNEIEN